MLKTLGRLHIADERDGNYPFSSALKSAPVRNKTKYYRATPILDQGYKPHCVAFAWKQFLQSSPFCQGRQLKEDFIYELCQERDQWPGENYDGTSVRAGAKVLQKLGFLDVYLWARTAEEVKQWILSTSPVVLGTTWYSGMFQTDDDGFVHAEGGVAGGHAYLCVGYSHKRKAFRCVNSWGEGWGEEGRFWISEADLDRLLSQSGEACTAKEVRMK
jgi:hypothetical protein